MIKAETIRVKERLDVSRLETENTRIVPSGRNASVSIMELKGSLLVDGEVSLRVDMCDETARITVNGMVTFHLDCKATVIPTERSTLVVDGGVAVVRSAEQFMLTTHNVPTITSREMHVVFQDSNASLLLCTECFLAFTKGTNVSVVVVGTHQFPNEVKTGSVEKQIVFDENGNCNGLCLSRLTSSTPHHR